MNKLTTVALATILVLSLLAMPAFAEPDPVVTAVDNYLTKLPSDWFQMKPEVLLQKLDIGEEIFVLDVRRPDEFAAGHVEGAVNIEVHELAKHIDQLPDDPNALIVVYCRSGVRSMFGTSALLMLGFNRVYNMPGGFLAWQDAGYPIAH
ncbi:MAG: rhodanese-like domain-containing protein [Clostridia bacterium]|nr:rhodanese-like domain-containing protein [Clostridia bacterium]